VRLLARMLAVSSRTFLINESARKAQGEWDGPFRYSNSRVINWFSIAAPIGPTGVLCIKRTLAEGRASGFSCGLGAASADAIYGGLAAFGLISTSNFLSTTSPGCAT